MTDRDDYDPYWDYDDECWNCGGEGYVYGCSWDWQCDTWDGDSCLCSRPCDVCQPRKPNPELQRVLADALRDSDAMLGTKPEGLSREAVAARAAESGIAQPLSQPFQPHPKDSSPCP